MTNTTTKPSVEPLSLKKRKRAGTQKRTHQRATTNSHHCHDHAKKKRCISPTTITVHENTRKPQLPRPRSPITFSLPKHLVDNCPAPTSPQPRPLKHLKDSRSRSSTPTVSQATDGDESSILRLSRINILLDAIHRRNKNQHRNQPFYRYLSSLRRSVTRLIHLHEQSTVLSSVRSAPASLGNRSNTAAETREHFEMESHLRSQRGILEEHVREVVVPAAYVAFSAVVADTQFANLGVVLLGVLADTAGIVGLMRKVEEKKQIEIRREILAGRLVGLSTLITGPDQGTVVERVYDSDNNAGTVAEVELPPKRLRDRGDMGSDDMGEVIQRKEHNQHEVDDSRNLAREQSSGNQEEQERPDGIQDTSVDKASEQDVIRNSSTAQSEERAQTHVSTDTDLSSTPPPQDTREAPVQPIKFQQVRNRSTKLDNSKPKPPKQPSYAHATFVTPTQIPPTATTIPSSPPPAAATVPIQKNSTTTPRPRFTSPPSTTTATKSSEKTTKARTTDPNPNPRPREQQPSTKPSKKKRKKNAIDDLFNGFG